MDVPSLADLMRALGGDSVGNMFVGVEEFSRKATQSSRGSSLWVVVTYQEEGTFFWGDPISKSFPVDRYDGNAGYRNYWYFRSDSQFFDNAYAQRRFWEESGKALRSIYYEE